MNIVKSLDVSGLFCAMPIVQMKAALDTMKAGEVLEVIGTDKGAIKDIPIWSNTCNHVVLAQKEAKNTFYFYIQKGHS